MLSTIVAWDVRHDDGDLFYESWCAHMTRG